MDDEGVPDDSISILGDAYIGPAGYSGDAAADREIPDFQIYTNHPHDVGDASHYALYLTCQTLQKRNKDLEQQMAKLQKITSKCYHKSDLQSEGCSPSASVTEPRDDKDKGPSSREAFGMCDPAMVTDYTKYIVDRLTGVEKVNGELTTELEEQKLIVLELKKKTSAQAEALGELHLKMLSLQTENDNLKSICAEKCRELSDIPAKYETKIKHLNTDLLSIQQLYEEKVRRVKDLELKENSWELERARLRDEILKQRAQIACSEKKKLGFFKRNKSSSSAQYDKGPTKTLVEDDGLSEDLLQLHRQLTHLKSIIQDQSYIIKQLVEKKQDSDRSCDLPNSSVRDQSETVYCGYDLERCTGDDEEDTYLYRPQASLINDEISYLPEPNRMTAQIMPRVSNNFGNPSGDDIRTMIAYPPSSDAVVDQSQADDNRLNVAVVPPRVRTIEIERNVNGTGMGSPSNHLRNINLTEMMHDKQTEFASGSHSVVMNNSPLVGTKHIPTRNISTSKTCPVCENSFPAEMKQADFENHVKTCLCSSEAGAVSQSMAAVEQSGDVVIKECPVCNDVLPLEFSQSDFEIHVNSHFDNEYEVIAQ